MSLNITPFFDGITLELTPPSNTNVTVYWEYMNPNLVDSGSTTLSKQFVHFDKTQVHRVVATSGNDTWAADIRTVNPLLWTSNGDTTWPSAPPLTILNYLPITLTLYIDGVDNYDWNGNRPDHNYPDGLNCYTLPSILSSGLDLNLAMPTVMLYPNPYSHSIPFNINYNADRKLFTDRLYYGEFDISVGQDDSVTSTLWAPESDISEKEYRGHWETPVQLGDFSYNDNSGNQQTGHRVITRRQYRFLTRDTDTPDAYVTTTVIEVRPGPTPSPI